MINDRKQKLLDNLLLDLSKEDIIWINGYLSGINRDVKLPLRDDRNSEFICDKLTIIYAGETGNCKKIANSLNAKFKKLPIKTKIKAIEQYDPTSLVKESYVVFVTSTHGDGELPETAREFWSYLERENPKLSDLKYSILSLGDSNYPAFCEAGKLLNNKFLDLGGELLNKITEFDLDFEDQIEKWESGIISLLEKKKSNHFVGKISNNVILNDKGSNKEIHHIEIVTDAKYLSGDSIGIKLGNEKPRLYSISSSPDEHEGEIHLTVKNLENGLCSPFLSDLKIDDKLDFYISPNNSFRLPEENEDVIMVSAGTGIAPFRSFLMQRNFDDVSGKNWLFFGEQYAKKDFLYQSELQAYLESGLLTKLDLAFSRDQKEKIYVQNKIKENANELRKWLESGAYFYICGDKHGMAKEVEKSLIEIIGKNYLNKMLEENRYLKDIY